MKGFQQTFALCLHRAIINSHVRYLLGLFNILSAFHCPTLEDYFVC